MAWVVIFTHGVLVGMIAWRLMTEWSMSALFTCVIWVVMVAVNVPTLRRLLDPTFGQR
jgi:hypothetical protein